MTVYIVAVELVVIAVAGRKANGTEARSAMTAIEPMTLVIAVVECVRVGWPAGCSDQTYPKTKHMAGPLDVHLSSYL